jgi:uncharacterized protein (DUF1330 family)
MAAYVIGEVEVTDPKIYDDYRKQVLATIEKYGGRFVARGGKAEPLEGGWSPKRIVVLEFPSYERALEWYRSPEYAPLIKLRQKASRAELILVAGA